MRSVVAHGPNDVRVDEIPRPQRKRGEALIRVEWGGICGSDVAYWKSAASGTAVMTQPMTLGHEVSGRVCEIDDDDGWRIGDAVTVHPALLVGDGVMPERLAGRTNLYPSVRYLGSAAFTPHTNGGFSEFIAVPTGQLRRLPANIDTRLGVLAEPFGVAIHASRRAGPVEGREVLVNGCGPVGLLVIAALARQGARRIIASDVNPAALDIARQVGASDCVDVASGAALPTDVELVIEASGAPAALGGVLHATARGGTIVQVGNLPGAPASAVLGDLVTREITWMGSYRFADEITDALDFMAAGVDVSGIIAGSFSIDDVQAAFRTASDRSTAGKVLLRF